jgi:hypothetical protein
MLPDDELDRFIKEAVEEKETRTEREKQATIAKIKQLAGAGARKRQEGGACEQECGYAGEEGGMTRLLIERWDFCRNLRNVCYCVRGPETIHRLHHGRRVSDLCSVFLAR